jgi:carboxymethylenebutenolidase
MFNDITKPPPPLPVIQLEKVSDGVHLLHPLSRRGHGPGLIILVPNHAKQVAIESGVPSALIKWAEEGYAVVEIQHGALTTRAQGAVREAIEALARCENCESTAKTGLIGSISFTCTAEKCCV